jgi:hypothetical protein
MQLVCGVEVSYTKGRIHYGDQEGNTEVREENLFEEDTGEKEQLEEIQFLAEVQSIGRQRR